MPRPKKWRKIEFIPEFTLFKPAGIPKSKLEEIELNIDELEAMRLKDLGSLSQAECAEKMNVSRQTFQLIIDSARVKVTTALTSGKAINITGGKYTLNVCKYICGACGHEFSAPYEEIVHCPECKSLELLCKKKNNFCKHECDKIQSE